MSLKVPQLTPFDESHCDNLVETKRRIRARSSDILQTETNSSTLQSANTSTTIIEQSVSYLDDSNSTELGNDINYNNSNTENRNSSYVESVKFSTESENKIHQRYIEYFKQSQSERDTNKTDYTYAHSYSYSPLIPYKNQYKWQVPNMSRSSIKSNHRTKPISTSSSTSHFIRDDETADNSDAASVSQTSTTHSRKVVRTATTSSFDMTASSSPSYLNGKARLRRKPTEFSDDDEDNEEFSTQLSQPKLNGVLPKKAIIHEDDEEEELTIIRRIHRLFVRTVNNFLPSNSQSNIHLQTEISKNSRLHSNSLHHNQKSFSSLTKILYFFIIVGILSGAYYTVPENSLNNLISEMSSVSSSFIEKFHTKTEFRNADQITAEIERLKNEVHKLQSRSRENSGPHPSQTNFDDILLRIEQLEGQVATLKPCCDKKPQEIDTVALTSNITDRVQNDMQGSLNNSLLVFQEKYDQQSAKYDALVEELKSMDSKLSSFIQDQINQRSSEQASQTVVTLPQDSPDLTMVQDMIRQAILKYDADKTGEADFALESAGAWIMSTRCSETYQLNSASYKIFGLTMWKSSSSPRVVIQPGVIPGECWCFRGGEGRLGIHLSANIIPSAFSYEHIPQSLSRDGHIQSAPKSFAVYGLKEDNDLEPELLGEYIYSIENNEPLQRFEVQKSQTAEHGFDKIEIVIKSNHGHPEYTCLYRYRVHGTVAAMTTKV